MLSYLIECVKGEERKREMKNKIFLNPQQEKLDFLLIMWRKICLPCEITNFRFVRHFIQRSNRNSIEIKIILYNNESIERNG